jgi:hypothetical protein
MAITTVVTGSKITGFSGSVVGLELKGSEEVIGKIQAAMLQIGVKAEAALYQVAEQEMTESKKRVPVDLGNLKNSGHVQHPERDAEGISLKMGFGGPAGAGNVGGETNKEDVGYAIVVHEDLEAFHKVGQAKYLESVLQESAPYLLERIANRIKL